MSYDIFYKLYLLLVGLCQYNPCGKSVCPQSYDIHEPRGLKQIILLKQHVPSFILWEVINSLSACANTILVAKVFVISLMTAMNLEGLSRLYSSSNTFPVLFFEKWLTPWSSFLNSNHNLTCPYFRILLAFSMPSEVADHFVVSWGKTWLESKQNNVACLSDISLHRKSLCDQCHLALAKR